MQKIFRWLTLGVILSLLVGMTGQTVPAADTAAWQEKVEPQVLAAAPEGETEFLVFLREQADLSGAATLKDKTAKGSYVYETLTSIAETTQKSVRASLDSLGVPYQSFWIVNMLWVRGDLNLIQEMAQRPDVAHIYANPQIRTTLPELETRIEPMATTSIEWNILKINADDVWGAGYTGQGVVIGGQDTGYVWDHLALINQYRGWDGATVNHDYNWYDATGLSPNTPVDPHGHGTHTMGTMVGDDGLGNQVGVAPGARWIGCRNMDNAGNGTPATYMDCYEWFLAPTRTDGSDPRPDLAPDVINNSWSCPTGEGCTNLNVLLDAVKAVRAAGILTVHSAGNSGPSCGTVNEPATIYEESFSVGSTTSSDTISSFSSRGPVTVDGSNRFKPQVTAPGSSIRSTTNNGNYGYMSGTSMAAPHVAGLAALLISAQPGLAGKVNDLEDQIEQSAVPINATQDCGEETPFSHPNYTFGWGRVDAWAAYLTTQQQHTLELDKVVSDRVAMPGSLLTYTLTITHHHAISATHNVILDDIIPDGTTFVTATLPHTLAGETVTWEIGDLAAGESTQAALTVQVPITTPLGTVINNQYSAYSDEAALVIGNPVSTTIHNLAVEKSAPALVVSNYPLTYTLTVTNLQPEAGTHNIVLSDTLPTGTSFITATGSYSVTDDLVIWEIGDLGPQTSASVDLVVLVTAGGTIINAGYGAISNEVSVPAMGEAVITSVHTPGVKWGGGNACLDQWLNPGEMLTCQYYLYNAGNYIDTYQLTGTSIHGKVEITPTSFTIPSGLTGPITATITASMDAPGRTEVTTTLIATSMADPNVNDTLEITSWVYHRWFLPLILGEKE